MRKIKNASVQALQGITFMLEDLLAWSVLVALVIYSGALIWKYITHPGLLQTSLGIHSLLADALLVAMGAEFVRTFLQHTPETVVEVLTFAIARHMVLQPGSMVEMLAGCGAVLLMMLGQYYVSDKRAKRVQEARATERYGVGNTQEEDSSLQTV